MTGPAPTTASPASDERASTRLGGTRPAEVLVVEPDSTKRAELVRWLGERGAVALAADRAASAWDLVQNATPEIAIMNLVVGTFEGPAIALAVVRACPGIETFLVCDDPALPDLEAALAVGLTRIHDRAVLLARLDGALAVLTAAVRAGRRAASLRASVAPFPTVTPIMPHPPRHTLVQGEMRYRETYIRAMMAHSSSKADAAAAAGHNYSTWCGLIKKLGIGTEGFER